MLNMPKLRLLLVAFLLPLGAQDPVELDQLAWISGQWAGPLGRGTAEEVWLSPAGGAMLGLSRVISSGRMLAFEYMRIERRGNDIYYVAQPGGRPPTAFQLTKLEGQSALFENAGHDFPQRIRYRREGPDSLLATIEGEIKGQLRRQEFRFRRSAP